MKIVQMARRDGEWHGIVGIQTGQDMWPRATDAMQRHGFRYGELIYHIEDLMAGHVLTAEDGTEFRVIEAPFTVQGGWGEGQFIEAFATYTEAEGWAERARAAGRGATVYQEGVGIDRYGKRHAELMVAETATHSEGCMAAAMICAIENLRDDTTLDLHHSLTVRPALIQEWAAYYLAEGITTCRCDKGGR